MDDPTNLSLRQVQTTASEFLRNYHPALTVPIPIEEIAELQLGIKIVLIKGLVRDFGVNAFITQSFDTIVIDEAMYVRQPERIRFTIAEEIGHLLLHKTWYQKHGPKDAGDYLTWQERLDGKLFDYIERQAKTLASMVLMPENILRAQWERFREQYHLPSPCSIYSIPDTFPEIAHAFAVSPDSLLVRLSFLKLVIIPDGFWEKIKRR